MLASPSPRTVAISLSVYVAWIVVIWLAVTATRGAWFDDLWTLYMSQPQAGIGQSLRHLWLQDVHPPLFYALNRASWEVVGAQMLPHRLLNLIPLALLSTYVAALAARDASLRKPILVAAVLLLSNPDFSYITEHRSYFTTLCAVTALILTLLVVEREPTDLSFSRSRFLPIATAATILLALNLHYISALVSGITISVIAADVARRGHWRWAAWMVGWAAAGSLLLIGALIAELPYIRLAAPAFWIDTPPFKALRFIRGHVLAAFGVNIAAIAAVALSCLRLWQRRDDAPSSNDLRFALLMLISVGFAAAVLGGIGFVKPILVPRYLNALTPPSVVAISCLAASVLMQRLWVFVLFIVNAALAILPLARSEYKEPRWEAGARIVAATVAACPGTLVYGIDRTYLPPASHHTNLALPN